MLHPLLCHQCDFFRGVDKKNNTGLWLVRRFICIFFLTPAHPQKGGGRGRGEHCCGERRCGAVESVLLPPGRARHPEQRLGEV